MPRDSQGRFAPADTDTFMKLWVDRGDIVEIETDNGSTVVPCSVCGLPDDDVEPNVEYALDDEETSAEQKAWARSVRDYCEGTPTAFTYRPNVWYGRYSAPGYMDCTDYSWSNNRRELERELRSMYGDD